MTLLKCHFTSYINCKAISSLKEPHELTLDLIPTHLVSWLWLRLETHNLAAYTICIAPNLQTSSASNKIEERTKSMRRLQKKFK